MIAHGTHRAICKSIQWGRTDKDKPQLVISFEILGDEDPDKGYKVTYYGMLEDAIPPKTKGPYDFTIEALRNIGWDGDDLAEIAGLADSGQLNHEVWLVIEHEEYQGKTSAKVKWVNRPGGGAVQLKKPMDEREVKELAAQMKQRLRADAAKRTKRPPPVSGAQHPNAPGADSEAPPVDEY